jgi:hypothetical protein
LFVCRNQKRELGLATMLLCVVMVFFLCNFLALVVNILEVRMSFYYLIFRLQIFQLLYLKYSDKYYQTADISALIFKIF